MKKKADLTGMVFGRWKVIEIGSVDRHGHQRWLCEYTCPLHTIKEVLGDSLVRGVSRSCGCYNLVWGCS